MGIRDDGAIAPNASVMRKAYVPLPSVCGPIYYNITLQASIVNFCGFCQRPVLRFLHRIVERDYSR